MLSLTRSTAIEGRDVKIRANAVLPGAIDTPMLWNNPNVQSGAEVIDTKDVGTPEDIAAAVAFLASDDAKFITGASLAVDGGRLAKL
jgi:NAD(P)-dependent dehydrogenase (short-subunit alcohol dehydrogenase family)